MKFSVQTDELNRLKKALASSCNEVRFGSEFCEYKIPSISTLKKVYALTTERQKVFVYVTPRVSTNGIRKIQEQLDFLNRKGKINVIINDLGVLNVIGNYPELKPHLGRQLIYTPGRSPWLNWKTKDAVRYFPSSLISKIKMRHIKDLYSRTSLNYAPTAQFFRRYNVRHIDVDWIPRCFPYYSLLVEKGFNTSVHIHLVFVTITRKCHTARFLREKNPETCSRPCDKRAFLLKTPVGSELFLHGNVVFRFVQFSREDLKRLLNNKITEFVITMNPITKVLSCRKIDDLIFQIRDMVKTF